ncbi:hypothetical protein HK405_002438, partial [Cladochytrium tenue]
MVTFYDELPPALARFLLAQHLFFVASGTAPDASSSSPKSSSTPRINVSPKGHARACLWLASPRRAAYLDLTGSGAETAAHLRADGRVTLMACAFVGAPRIVRLFGTGVYAERGSPEFEVLLREVAAAAGTAGDTADDAGDDINKGEDDEVDAADSAAALARRSRRFLALASHAGCRGAVLVDVQLAASSCGYAVPQLEFRADRETLKQWAENKGEAGLQQYRAEKNARSIDGLPALPSQSAAVTATRAAAPAATWSFAGPSFVTGL